MASPLDPDPATVPEPAPALVAELERLADELAARPDSGDLAHRFEYLVDVLVLRGHLRPAHRAMIERIKADRSTVELAHYRDKYAVTGADIDCAARIPLCKARCCSFTVTLSPQDVAEGKLPWDLHRPYRLPQVQATGYCGCMGQDGGCTVYAARPGTCRAYDCRHDGRVWIDFEQRIPAPMPDDLVPPM